MPGAYLEDDCGNYTQPVSLVPPQPPTVSHPLQDNQIMDLDHVEAGGVIFRSRVDTEDMDSIHSETVSFICHPTPPSHTFPGWRSDNGPR